MAKGNHRSVMPQICKRALVPSMDKRLNRSALPFACGLCGVLVKQAKGRCDRTAREQAKNSGLASVQMRRTDLGTSSKEWSASVIQSAFRLCIGNGRKKEVHSSCILRQYRQLPDAALPFSNSRTSICTSAPKRRSTASGQETSVNLCFRTSRWRLRMFAHLTPCAPRAPR